MSKIAIRQEITEMLRMAVSQAQEQGSLPGVSLPEIILERPQNPDFGDYASSLPLKLARAVSLNPLSIARELVTFMPPRQEIEKVEIAPPGFINFTFRDSWLVGQVASVLAAGDAYGDSNVGQGSRVQVEFVSVNPTGPLHVGHGRGAVMGSTLANVLTISGYQVEKEYYINDAGSQMDVFKRSLYARYLQCLDKDAEMPPNGYHGSYMTLLAKEIITEVGDKFLSLPKEQAIRELGEIGLKGMLAQIKNDLEKLGVTFDGWFSERSLYKNGQYQTVMNLLKEKGYIAGKEGATWFVSTALGEDKDNVVVRTDGAPTYFAADIAYHYNKFTQRKFDKVINIWGADHQGHVARMKAAVDALGVAPDRLKIIIAQMVTLRRGAEIVRLSKRSGDIISLREVMDEVGTDACRFFFLGRSADSQMDFDLELAKKESSENPVYYIQYAHARIMSILRLAKERGLSYEDGDVALLTSKPELTLIRKMLMFPEVVETVIQTLGPHHLPYFAQELATAFHTFYRDCRVISSNEGLTKARLTLVSATRLVLAKTLNLMGMTAPESM